MNPGLLVDAGCLSNLIRQVAVTASCRPACPVIHVPRFAVKLKLGSHMVNRTHGRFGHVFQGRYKAILVEKDSYLLELARYVVLNPLRAGMVSDAADWAWSSYPAMIGQAPLPAWLRTDLLGGRSSLIMR